MKDTNEAPRNPLLAFDAPSAAPEHHRIIFENDRVRVLDFRVPAGETVPLHTHRWATVNYVVSRGDFLSYDDEGNVELDSRTAEVGQSEGSVFFQPAFPPLHSVVNIGQSEIRGVTVELKN
jgi:quercetin dioxygenase-like cupin family protein